MPNSAEQKQNSKKEERREKLQALADFMFDSFVKDRLKLENKNNIKISNEQRK